MVEAGKTRDPFLIIYIRNIWLLTATMDIQSSISYVPGAYNVIADTLSRIHSNKPGNKDIL